MASWFFKHVASNGRSHRNSLTGEPDLGHSPYQTWIVRLLCGDLMLLFLGSWRFPCCVCVCVLSSQLHIHNTIPVPYTTETRKQANKQTSKQASKQTGKQANKQTNKQSKQANKQSKQSKPKRAKASSKKQETNRKSQPIKSKIEKGK